MKQRLTQSVKDAVGQIESLVVGQVAEVMSRDDSEFRMARFPVFIQVTSASPSVSWVLNQSHRSDS